MIADGLMKEAPQPRANYVLDLTRGRFVSLVPTSNQITDSGVKANVLQQ